MTVSTRLTRKTELGTEQLCNGCRNWWPADTEFFHAAPEGGLRSLCKVCNQAAASARLGRIRPLPPVPEVFSAIRWGTAA